MYPVNSKPFIFPTAFVSQPTIFHPWLMCLDCSFINGLEFTGYIDRIDKKDEQYLVIDYKSGKVTNPKDAEKLTDFQMSIYQKLLDKPSSKIDFAYIKILEDGKLEYLIEQEAKEQKLLEHIEYIKSLESIVPTRCESLQNCRYCPYQLLCHRGEYL